MKERETAADIVIKDLGIACEAVGAVTEKIIPRVNEVFVRTVVGPAVRRIQKVFRC